MSNLVEKLVTEAQAHAQEQRWQQALDCLRSASEHQPNNPGIWFSVGEVYRAANVIAGARQAYEHAIRLAPRFPQAHLHLAIVLDLEGETARALNHALEAVQIDPLLAPAVITATNLLLKTGHVEQSIQMGRRAVALSPDSVVAWLNLGNALLNKPETKSEAEQAYRRAVEVAPGFAPAHNALGTVLNGKEDFDGAIEHYQKATELDPNFFASWPNLSQALSAVGLIGDSIDAARKGLALAPHAIQLSKMLLFTLSYTDLPDQEILDEHRRFFETLKITSDYNRDRRSNSDIIRVGYFSPDFRDHPISSFIEPLLASHDRSHFEIFCYQGMGSSDVVTKRLQSYPVTWRDIALLSDDDAIRTIRADQLDVLIDLAGHTRGGRLELFARRLAPIQISYLGYPTTTGLAEMDYRLTDSIADPPTDLTGEDTSGYVEQLARMPNCFCCFSPPRDAPDIGPLPAEKNGFITFGSLHSMSKVNDRVIGLWSAVLSAVPNSRLLMVRHSITPATQERLLKLFALHGIDPARITFNNQSNPPGGHLTFYNQIDISLDTFPFTGHTTACQSLFMGVPIVTLAGPSHRQRLVATVLSHAGHKEWTAQTPEEYVEIVRHLAGDIAGLAKLRQNLRQELIASPLYDAASFTKDFEATIDRLVRQKLENLQASP